MKSSYGARLRQVAAQDRILPFIGVYDVFSATIAAQHFEALFASGFGFAASHYGLPDIGFIAWSDLVAFVHRVRSVLPAHHLLVDIDDGYGDPEVACHVVSLLERLGASGVVLEDQKRPRRCGHFEGKQILELDEFLAKLKRILAVREDLFVVARTDASDQDEVVRRVEAFAAAGADAVLADGLRNLETIRALKRRVSVPLAFNQIAGGNSPPCRLSELQALGASLVIYSTPCLFAAQAAVEDAMTALKENDGNLRAAPHCRIGVNECTALLNENLARRDMERSRSEVPATT